jgi:hypothetical protein
VAARAADLFGRLYRAQGAGFQLLPVSLCWQGGVFRLFVCRAARQRLLLLAAGATCARRQPHNTQNQLPTQTQQTDPNNTNQQQPHQGLEEWKFPKDWFLPQSKGTGKFNADDLEFQEKILMR